MEKPLEIPEAVPVMTLPGIVLFPHAVLPLHIFEPRYRKMLEEVLEGDRLFAVAFKSPSTALTGNGAETPKTNCATIGIIRASQKNADGTSNLVLQGLTRVRLLEHIREEPFPLARIEAIETEEAPQSYQPLRMELKARIKADKDLGSDLPKEFVEFIDSIEDPEVYVDYLAYSICACPETKQRLLDTIDVGERYEVFLRYLEDREVRRKLYSLLQGKTRDDEIERN